MKITHVVVPLDLVLRSFAEGFKTTSGKTPHFSRGYLDTHKQEVVFEFYLDNDASLDRSNPPSQSQP